MSDSELNNNRQLGTAASKATTKAHVSERNNNTYDSSEIHATNRDKHGALMSQTSTAKHTVTDLPNETFDWHKEILLGLFLRSDEDELLWLSKMAESHNFLNIHTNSSYTDNLITAKGVLSLPTLEKSPGPSCLTVVPEVLRMNPKLAKRSFSVMMESKNTKGDALSKWKHKDFASQSLEETKEAVFLKFCEAEELRATQGPSIEFESMPTTIPNNKDVTRKYSPDLVSKRTSTSSFDSEEKTLPETLSSSYEPFALKYNECSIAAISKWAAGGIYDKFAQEAHDKSITMDSSVFSYPAASPFFKRCFSCGNWGHYDIECDYLAENDIMQLAPSTKVQRTLRSFVEEETIKNARQPQLTCNEHSQHSLVCLDSACSSMAQNIDGCNNAEKQRDDPFGIKTNAGSATDLSSQPVSDEFLIKSNACEICGSGFRGEDLLLCDGCDGLFHFQCLEPPLESVPEGDWFCSKCSGYDSDVSSICEVECCEGFVIEQLKNPALETCGISASEKHEDTLFSESSWALPVSILKENTQYKSHNRDNEEEEMIGCTGDVDRDKCK
mmetsp:Transcript_48921/g.73967  ORF Transcript_48921/g.73967 Transcript_48921/m.73967 type:complete len:556 (-) Transcript_48921:7-1674(-)